VTSKGWREGEEDDAVMESKGDGVSERGVEALAGSSKQGGEPAVAKSCADKVGTVKVGSVGPPHGCCGREGGTALIALGAQGRFRHPVQWRGRTHRQAGLLGRSSADACPTNAEAGVAAA
jgi:hypothetical protein